MASTVSKTTEEVFLPLQTLQETIGDIPPDSAQIDHIQKTFRDVVQSGVLQQPCSTKNREVVHYICGLTTKSNEPICKKELFDHASKSLAECTSVAMLHDFCKSAEGEEVLHSRDEQFIQSFYSQIRTILISSSPLERLELLFACLKPHLSTEEIEQYDAHAVRLLHEQYFSSDENFSFQETVQRLRDEGFPLTRIEEVLYPRLDELEKKWCGLVSEALAGCSVTDADSLTVHIHDAFAELQERMSVDTQQFIKLSEQLPKEVQESLLYRAMSTQGKAIIAFAASAMESLIALISKTQMSKEEYAGVLSLIEKLRSDIEVCQKSPAAAELASLNTLSTQMGTLIEKIKKESEDCDLHPELHLSRRQRTTATMLKVARCVYHCLRFVPYVVFYVLPVALSIYAGYRAGGIRGAVICGGVATVTSLLASYSKKIAQKTSEQLATIPGIPQDLLKPAGSLISLSLHVILVILSLQANGVVAGAVAKTTESSPPPQSAWYPKRVWDSGEHLLSSTKNFGYGMYAFLAQEISLAVSALHLSTGNGSLSQNLRTTADAQIEAIVAGYQLGSAVVELPMACGNLVKTTVGL